MYPEQYNKMKENNDAIICVNNITNNINTDNNNNNNNDTNTINVSTNTNKNVTNAPNTRINFISGLRLGCQLWIIAWHLFPKKSHPFFGNIPMHCPAAITCFFVVSGFVNELCYGDNMTTKYNISYVGYYARRYLPILPAYWLACITAIIVGKYRLGLPTNLSDIFSLQAISIYTMTWTWWSSTQRVITWRPNGAIWFMSSISLCWFLYPFLRKLLNRITNNKTSTLITYIISLGISVTPTILLVSNPEQGPPFYGGSAFGYWYISPYQRIPQFWLGMVMAKMYRHQIGFMNSVNDNDNSNTNQIQNIFKIIKKIIKNTFWPIFTSVFGFCIIYFYAYAKMPEYITELKWNTILWMGCAPIFSIFIYGCLTPNSDYNIFVHALSSQAARALDYGATLAYVYVFQTPVHYLLGGDFYAKLIILFCIGLCLNYHIHAKLDKIVKQKFTAKYPITDAVSEKERNYYNYSENMNKEKKLSLFEMQSPSACLYKNDDSN